MLSILETSKVKATFFCIGKNAENNTNLLRDIHQQGHIIGSHSYSHSFWFDLLSPKKMEADLSQAHNLLRQRWSLT
ncbi:polysaccharide deacetylase family protein [Niabella hibiscisoli]|uniref:polysaccharide deacetylase family protein n=1 Tax=Niabella hibiscisoli TaxID=1825928 RepID=UPI00374DE531